MTADSLLDKVNWRLLDKGRPVLVGVSGGTDSLALLYLLNSAGYTVIAAHFNHHLRPDADDDARFVEETARQLGCATIGGVGDVAAAAQAEKTSIEAAARQARYQFLFTQAEAYGAQAVAVGHNADDQVETVLMHILRGSSLAGLAGMRSRTILKQFSTHIPLVRPLLGIWRVELEAYCREAGLTPRFDLTNQDVAYTRNRIRQELIPILGGYNPQIKQRLYSLAVSAQNSLEILQKAVDQHYQDAFRAAGEGYRGFDRKTMAKLPESLQIEVIRRAAADLLPTSEDLDQAAYQRAAGLLVETDRDSRVDLADGLSAFTDADRFYVTLGAAPVRDARFPQIFSEAPIILNVPGRAALDHGWVIRSMWLETTEPVDPGSLKKDSSNVIMDADTIALPLTIRYRNPGDRFQPLGLTDGSVKLGDYFTNLKLPGVARSAWPLVLSGDTIIWVVGCQIADEVKIKASSRRFVQLRLEKIPNGE